MGTSHELYFDMASGQYSQCGALVVGSRPGSYSDFLLKNHLLQRGDMKLPSNHIPQQSVNSRFDMRGFGITEAAIFRLLHHALLACLLIFGTGSVVAFPVLLAHNATQQIELIGIRATVSDLDAATLSQQPGTQWVGDIVEFSPSGQHQSAPVIELRPEQGTENKESQGQKPWVRDGKQIDFFEHYKSLWTLAGYFFVGLIATLIIGFLQHTWRYGLNNAWRDLVFSWPIPYWMRFVPKDEQ
jgi:hypothetical protein